MIYLCIRMFKLEYAYVYATNLVNVESKQRSISRFIVNCSVQTEQFFTLSTGLFIISIESSFKLASDQRIESVPLSINYVLNKRTAEFIVKLGQIERFK